MPLISGFCLECAKYSSNLRNCPKCGLEDLCPECMEDHDAPVSGQVCDGGE